MSPLRTASANSVRTCCRVSPGSAGIFGARLIGNGRLRPKGRSEVTASLNGLKINQAASVLGQSAAVRVAAAFAGFDWQRASISGTARSQSANLRFAATARPGTIRATFDSSVADSATVHGDVGLAIARRELSGALTGDITSLAQIGSHFDLPPLDGTARWSATLGGTTTHPAASLQLSAAGLAIGGWTGAALQANASYAAGHIAIGHARLAWAGQQLDATGEIGGLSEDAPLALGGTIQGTSLGPLFRYLDVAPVAEAAVSGRFQISGTAANPVAEAKLKTGELTVYGERFSRAELSARWQRGANPGKFLAPATVSGLRFRNTLLASRPIQRLLVRSTKSLATDADLPEYTVAN
jgi:autotransporter translocation and assembly factor TamB